MAHSYRELAPAPALRPYVECYWSAASPGDPGFQPREPLVPDLRIELIFNAGAAWRWFEAGAAASLRAPALACIGMRGSALDIQQPGRLDHFPEHGPSRAPGTAPSPVTIHLELNDVDAVWQQALAAGATVEMPLADQFWGARYGVLRDPFGHRWSLGKQLKHPSRQELDSAAKRVAT